MIYKDGNDFSYEYIKTDKTNIMDLPHFHSLFEVYILLRGTREFTVANTSVKLHGPAVLFISHGILHRAFSRGEALRVSANITFNQDFLSMFSDCLPDILTSKKYACILFKPSQEELEQFVAYLNKCIQDNSIYLKALIRCTVYCFLCQLENSKRLLELPLYEAIPNEAAIKILEYLNQHISEPFGLIDMAEYFGYNTQRISRMMKECIGTSFKDYVSTLRLNKAINLLTHSDSTIGEIADKCGFESANYFGDFFKKRTGVSPRNYRKMYHKD